MLLLYSPHDLTHAVLTGEVLAYSLGYSGREFVRVDDCLDALLDTLAMLFRNTVVC